MKKFSLAQAWILFFVVLSLHLQIHTLFQKNILSIQVWIPVALYLGVVSLFRIPKIFRLSPQLVVWAVLLCVYVWYSGYYPERDNDGISFWMPKARALQLFGFLPAVGQEDARFTISHSYPLGMIAPSVFIHSFFDYFDIRIHRLSFVFISLLLWWEFFYQSERHKLSRFWSQFLMLVLVGVQPSIWTHGYHDAPWALCGVLGLYFLFFEKNAKQAFPFIAFGMMAKVEATLLLSTSVVIAAIGERRPRWLVLLLLPLPWYFISRHLGLSPSRAIDWNPYSVGRVIKEIGIHTWPLLKFATLYGGTSAALYLALKEVWGVKKQALLVAVMAIGVYIANYTFSSFDLAWNVKFSWARIILFPLFVIIFLRHFQEAEEQYA